MATPWHPKTKPVPGARRGDWILPGLMLLTVAVLAVIGAVTLGVLALRWWAS